MSDNVAAGMQIGSSAYDEAQRRRLERERLSNEMAGRASREEVGGAVFEQEQSKIGLAQDKFRAEQEELRRKELADAGLLPIENREREARITLLGAQTAGQRSLTGMRTGPGNLANYNLRGLIEQDKNLRNERTYYKDNPDRQAAIDISIGKVGEAIDRLRNPDGSLPGQAVDVGTEKQNGGFLSSIGRGIGKAMGYLGTPQGRYNLAEEMAGIKSSAESNKSTPPNPGMISVTDISTGQRGWVNPGFNTKKYRAN